MNEFCPNNSLYNEIYYSFNHPRNISSLGIRDSLEKSITDWRLSLNIDINQLGFSLREKILNSVYRPVYFSLYDSIVSNIIWSSLRNRLLLSSSSWEFL